MQIKKIRINNFYSFKEAEINFEDYVGITRVVGINKDSTGSNGAGKSSIFEAVSWGIYGRTIRRSTEEALVNSKAGSNCFVEVEIEQDNVGQIFIKRSKRPTSLTVAVNGVISNKENAIETQKYLESILESDHKSFLAATVFGQHSDFNFLDSSPEEKRIIIRNCFNLDDLFSKRQAVKLLKSKVTGELKSLDAVYNSSKLELKSLEKLLPNNKYKLVDLPSLEEILKAEKEISSLNEKIRSNQLSLKKLEKDIDKARQASDRGEFEEKSECPICKNQYTVCQTKENIQNLSLKVLELSGQMMVLFANNKEHQDSIDRLKPQYTSQEWAKYNEKNVLIQQAQYHIDKYNDLKAKVDEHEKTIKVLNQDLEVMKFWEKAFSEQGMIRYIIRNILEYFNLKSNEYLSILSNNQFTIEFLDDLSETIMNNGRPTKYISLSGGEKRRVNLAIMLSLQDMQNKISKTKTNLLFFDEVCDNIDDLGIEAIHNLLNTLRDQYSDKVIFLISHNNYLNDLFSEVKQIQVVKHKGISKIT